MSEISFKLNLVIIELKGSIHSGMLMLFITCDIQSPWDCKHLQKIFDKYLLI